MKFLAKPASGHFLRQWRKKRELSQQEAAEKIGLTQATLSKVERGILLYNQDQLEKLAELYECTPADLLTVNPFEPPPLATITALLQNATPSDIQRIEAVILALTQKNIADTAPMPPPTKQKPASKPKH